MNYVVFDLEFNQAEHLSKGDKTNTVLSCPFEVIQIGAVKLDENLKEIASFNNLIRPIIYSNLNKYVKAMTNIKLEDLYKANDFREVYLNFLKFIGNDSVLCVWGTVDLRELIRNIEFHKLDVNSLPKEYIDIQKHVSKFLNFQKGNFIGLGKAVEILEIPASNNFHDAYNDALYTSEVFKKAFDSSIKPKRYDITIKKAQAKIKCKIDIEKMFSQFEKMLNREITEEEKSIIKLAYMMGKTNQFIISPSKKS